MCCAHVHVQYGTSSDSDTTLQILQRSVLQLVPIHRQPPKIAPRPELTHLLRRAPPTYQQRPHGKRPQCAPTAPSSPPSPQEPPIPSRGKCQQQPRASRPAPTAPPWNRPSRGSCRGRRALGGSRRRGRASRGRLGSRLLGRPGYVFVLFLPGVVLSLLFSCSSPGTFL
jgi:hypothetical protein